MESIDFLGGVSWRHLRVCLAVDTEAGGTLTRTPGNVEDSRTAFLNLVFE